MTYANTVNINKDSRKQAGLQAQKNYPKGYDPISEHPILFCKASDRESLKRRLDKQPWKEWYEVLLHPMGEIAFAAKNLEELQSSNFNLKVFPIHGKKVQPVQSRFSWHSSIGNCALVGFLEGNKNYIDKARQLLLEAIDKNWCLGGWGGEDYEIGSGWDHAWGSNVELLLAYDLTANSFSSEEKLRFEARIARDLEWCQTDPLSPKYNPSWFGSVFMGVAALLLGRSDYVHKIESMLDQYVDQVLWGEGEYFEGASYQAGCMEPQNLVLIAAIRNVTGRDPTSNLRWAMRAEHWVRRSAPLGTDVTHSDANLVDCTAQILLAAIPSLPKEIASWVVWLYERIGDKNWFPLRGNDEERRQGIDRPTTIGLGSEPIRNPRFPYPYQTDPCFWLMVPDPMPIAVEPPKGSYIARNAGLGCLRSNWSLESMYTCVFAPRFYGSPHSHWDSLTFDFWAHGAYLIKNAGYHELLYSAPHIPAHLKKVLGVQPLPIPIKPPSPWTVWDGWNKDRCFRMAPDMHNIPTIDGGGGNHWESRADPMFFIVNTGWVQAIRVDGGIAGSYSCIGKLGSDGKVNRSMIQVEPDINKLGYLVIVDEIKPTENLNAKCDWFLHPRGEMAGTKSRLIWTTCDYLNFPPKDVRLEVCLPPEDLVYELKPDGCHVIGGSFQAGNYLDVNWRGARRFWSVLRPASDKEILPIARDLPNNRGLLIDDLDLILIKKIEEQNIEHDGIKSNATTLISRDKGKSFYLAIAATQADFGNGIGFDASDSIMITAKGLGGTVFVDRPHKQPQAMTPVSVTVLDPRINFGKKVVFENQQLTSCFSGGFTITLTTSGMHSWEILE